MPDGLDFTADAFAKMDPGERVSMCRRLAARAHKLAALCPPKEQDGYLLIARGWDKLADDIERYANGHDRP